MGIFALEKAEAGRSRPQANLNSQWRKVITMVDGYFKATYPDHVIVVFRRGE
jgi:hypothetical protein